MTIWPAESRATGSLARRACGLSCTLLLVATMACQQSGEKPSGEEPLASGPAATPPTGEVKTAPKVNTEAGAAALPTATDYAGPPDIVLVTIDTLRADSLGFSGNERVATPTLDRLAAGGRVFSFAHAHNVVTLPSHTNILTGRYPYEHGVHENSGFKLGDEIPTLATQLHAAGYATGAFVAAYPLDARFGLARGFDVYDDNYPVGSNPTEFVMAERGGDEVVRLARRWWKEQAGSPRFLWVHLYDPHAPYTPPEPFASRYAKEPYLGEVAATDAYLEPLLTPLLESRDGSTLLVVTSDHGEALGEHGELTHGLFAYEATLKIPLVLWGRGVVPGTDLTSVGHVDIYPTLLRAAGIKPPTDLPGRPLPLAGGSHPSTSPPARELYFEALSGSINRGWAPLHGLLAARHKLIRLPLPELYDLASDPAEANNLIDSHRRLANQLRGQIPPEALRPPTRGKISEEEIRRLRSLGYVASASSEEASFTAGNDPKNLIAIDRKLHQVVALYMERHLEQSAILAREIIAERPTMAIAYEHLSEALREQGRVDEAILALESALANGVSHPGVLRQLGLSLAEVGRGAEAIRLLTHTAKGEDVDSLNALAVAYYSAHDFAESATILQRVLGLDADNTKALETLGAVVLNQGKVAEAKRYLERAVEINPALPFSWTTLGVVRSRLGDNAGALKAWQRAVEFDPGSFDALYNIGWVAASMGQKKTAIRAFARFINTAPPSRGVEIRKAKQALARLENS